MATRGRGPFAGLLFYAMSDAPCVAWLVKGPAPEGALLLALPIAACSATSSVEHSPANFRAIESTVVVEASREAVFERLTNRLPAAGFASSNRRWLETDSRLVDHGSTGCLCRLRALAADLRGRVGCSGNLRVRASNERLLQAHQL